ncbi:hypothetical protein D1AOALGA4SA_3859 [Olavius algarvensis Delta 1 endosymbiont]|nr:hypothetical protein D1AOALGA4SA_3859 [Olavius algarvensis Delta 1 endosymbiont]
MIEENCYSRPLLWIRVRSKWFQVSGVRCQDTETQQLKFCH